MKKLTIEINGEDLFEIGAALESVLEQVMGGQVKGHCEEERGNYNFSITDERDIEQAARRHFEATRNAMGFTGPEWEDLGEMTRQVYRKSVTKQLALAECRRKQ